MTTHGHTGVCAWPVVTGQGVMGMAKAVSVGNQTLGPGPHPTEVAPAGIIEGIAEGAKNSIAAMSTVLTLLRTRLRIFICCPACPGTHPRALDRQSNCRISALRPRCPRRWLRLVWHRDPVQQAAGPCFRGGQLAIVPEIGGDHGHTGVCECAVGQGTGLIVPAKAVSVGSQAGRKVPQEGSDCVQLRVRPVGNAIIC